MYNFRRVTWVEKPSLEWKKKGFVDQRLFAIKSVSIINGNVKIVEALDINSTSLEEEALVRFAKEINNAISKPVFDLDTHKDYEEPKGTDLQSS